MALLPLSVIYWIIFFVLLKGIIDVFSKSKIKKEAGIKQLIAAVVMLIVGVGVCGYLLSGIGGMH
jgi:uncharacterized membrane protein HdeD (DUF308 family)